MNGAFDSQILAEKLSKLNNTQQSIETLSHWCIFHRKKAKLVVETWEKQFNSSEKEQRISFLYLANDILQNSRRKGFEFVGEFWKVLPAALKAVLENGDDRGKNIVTRLVDIWEERKVFGSRTRSLKEDMLGSEPPPPLETSRKSSRSVRIKLAVGSTPEKIVSAFQSMHSEHSHEDMALNKCKLVISRVTRMDKDIGINFPLASYKYPMEGLCSLSANLRTLTRGEQKKTSLLNELQEQEDVLKQCIDQLGTVKATREALVTQLKEALQEQESKLEHVRTQQQVAQANAAQAASMRQKLGNGIAGQPTGLDAPETTPGLPALHQNGQPSPADVKLPGKDSKTAAEIAAEVAAKLAASTSSAQMLTSVLSSFAAEEAKSAGLKTSTSHPGDTFPNLSPAKRVKLEEPTVRSDGAIAFFPSPQLVMPNLQQHPLAIQQPSASNVQGQVLAQQPTYALLPPPQQYVQTQGTGMMGLHYNYSSSTLPPPPPPPPPLPHQMVLARPAPLAHQPSAPSFQPLQPPPMGYYGQSSQPPNTLGPH
ncbi:uncharacterized protein LOC116262091 isoform X2 [Nymphaea colorata]|uniref:uncharacterized protein LOC116262091 isoform X2 n=1 Tax=Nymphaea colorata TaxID=210225 RepID=UPI00129D7A80|nr:uncharacterized protein LOC116262091 isoform X2 [Nymphaea colorata]